jgi:hypothetical protein
MKERKKKGIKKPRRVNIAAALCSLLKQLNFRKITEQPDYCLKKSFFFIVLQQLQLFIY